MEDESKHCFAFFTDVNYNWLSVPFSDGDFKSVTVRQPSSNRAQTSDEQEVHVDPEEPILNKAVYLIFASPKQYSPTKSHIVYSFKVL